jgi:YD repeat-containing protein
VGYQIDTSTGAFAFQDHDLDIQGGPLPLTLTHYYNGHSGQLGELGYRWTQTYDIHLAITGDATGDVGLIWGSGSEEYFVHNAQTGVFTPADARIHDTLVLNGDGTYSFVAIQANLTYHFTSAGQLVTIADLHGNAITLAYDNSNRLSTVTDPGGRSLTFAYNANSRLSTVTDPTGAHVSYGYDPVTGDLTSVTDPTGNVRTYTYSKHRLASFIDANGKTQFTNTMDAVNRVIQQTDEVTPLSWTDSWLTDQAAVASRNLLS